MNDIRERKRELRKAILKIRDSLSDRERKEKSEAIWNKLSRTDEFISAGMIYFFVGYGSEVQTSFMIKKTLEMGKRVAVPRVVNKTDMRFSEIHSLDELVLGYMGILEPEECAEAVNTAPDLVILPGVAFDRSHNRMGYGRGYYDRFLASIDPDIAGIAVCFEAQIVDEIPAEETDIRADMIITESRQFYSERQK